MLKAMSKFQGVLKMFMLGMLKTILKTMLKYEKNTITLYGTCWNWAADFIFLLRFCTCNWSETYVFLVSLHHQVSELANQKEEWWHNIWPCVVLNALYCYSTKDSILYQIFWTGLETGVKPYLLGSRPQSWSMVWFSSLITPRKSTLKGSLHLMNGSPLPMELL